MQHLSDMEHPEIKEVRGRGLLVAVEFKKPAAKEFCRILMRNGLLAKSTHKTTVRFAPPLIITRAQIRSAADIIRRSLADF